MSFFKLGLPAITLITSAITGIYLTHGYEDLVIKKKQDYFVARVLRKWQNDEDDVVAKWEYPTGQDLYKKSETETNVKNFRCQMKDDESWNFYFDNSCEFYKLTKSITSTDTSVAPATTIKPVKVATSVIPGVPITDAPKDLKHYDIEDINKISDHVTEMKNIVKDDWYVLKLQTRFFKSIPRNAKLYVVNMENGQSKKYLFEIIVKTPLFGLKNQLEFPPQLNHKLILVSRKKETDSTIDADPEKTTFLCKIKDEIIGKCHLYFFAKTPTATTPATPTVPAPKTKIKTKLEIEKEYELDTNVNLSNFKLQNAKKVFVKKQYKVVVDNVNPNPNTNPNVNPNTSTTAQKQEDLYYYYILNIETDFTPYIPGETIEIFTKPKLDLKTSNNTSTKSSPVVQTAITTTPTTDSTVATSFMKVKAIAGVLGNIAASNKSDFVIINTSTNKTLKHW